MKSMNRQLMICVISSALVLLAGDDDFAAPPAELPRPIAPAPADLPSASASAQLPLGPAKPPAIRIREGSQVADLVGTFRLTGDRVSFFTTDGERRFETLENLTLERVARALKESRDNAEWRVSGIVTEYQGINFLLVTRAIMKARNTATADSRARQ
jgi:hypothetical protein